MQLAQLATAATLTCNRFLSSMERVIKASCSLDSLSASSPLSLSSLPNLPTSSSSIECLDSSKSLN